MPKFAGFTAPQQHVLLQKLGYQGPMDEDEMSKFMMARPEAAIKMGKYAQMAEKRLNPEKGFAEGGTVAPEEIDYSQWSTYDPDTKQGYVDTLTTDYGGTVNRDDPLAGDVTDTREEFKQETGKWPGQDIIGYEEWLNEKYGEPSLDITKWETYDQGTQQAYVDDLTNKYGGNVDRTDQEKDDDREQFKQETGQWPTQDILGYEEWLENKYGAPVLGQDLEVTGEQSQQLTDTAIQSPEELLQKAGVAEGEAAQVDPNTGQITSPVPQGEVSTVAEKDIAQAQTPEEIEAAKYQAATSSDAIEQALQDVEAAQAEVRPEATVQGQLDLLMDDFEEGVPPWADGAVFESMAIMQDRGMGASSMAGQAIMQSAMEAAMPIAMADAQTYATYDLQNLANEQQTVMWKAQQEMASIFTDQAAVNAARQFNAMSENQTNQFFAQMKTTVDQFNAAQVNGMLQFNAGQENAMETFNTQLEEAREQFNAQNAVVIAQANANWRQEMTLSNTAAQNQANMLYAQQLNGLTAAAIDQVWQRERDLMDYAFTASESELDRELQLFIAQLDSETRRSMSDDNVLGAITGAVAGEFTSEIF